MANTARYWNTGLNDPGVMAAIEEYFSGFKNDFIPDEEQPIQAEFDVFARRMAGMVAPTTYTLRALSLLAQAMIHFLESERVAKEASSDEIANT